MRRNKTSLFTFGLAITLVLLLSVALHSQMIGNSINGNANSLIPQSGDSDELYALNGSFNVTEGLSWVQEITVLDNAYMGIDFSVGDRLRFTITEINSSTVDIKGILNTGEAVFCKLEYFNSTSGEWGTDPAQPETLLSLYNNTDNFNILDIPYQYGTYKWYTPLTEAGLMSFHHAFYDCIPSEFSTTNHTIVNNTYTNFQIGGSTTFNKVFTPGISSNWTMWNGTAGNDGSEPNSYKVVYVFNNKGVCTLSQLYKNGTSWDLVFEMKLIRMGPAYPFTFGNIIGSYKYKVTKANNTANIDISLSVGDTIHSTILNITPNFEYNPGEFVDAAFGIWEYINSTDGSNFTSPVIPISWYNNTNSFIEDGHPYQYLTSVLEAFFYSADTISFNFIPLDFFAANHTIINMSRYAIRLSDPASDLHYNYSQDLSTNNIAGTWAIWNGTAGNDGTESNTILMTITFNSQGVRTIQRLYQSGASGWELILEIVLEEEEGVPIDLLLLLGMFSGGEGIGMTTILIIALIAGIGVIVLIIAITKARG